MPTTRRPSRRAGRRSERSGPGRRPARAASPGWPGRSRHRRHRWPPGLRRGRPPTNRSRPSAARSAPTTAAASVRTPSSAMSKVAIGLIRATPGTAAMISASTPSSARDRPDRGEDQLARDDVGDPAGGRRPGMLADTAERDDHRQPDGQGAQRQRRSARGRARRSSREPLLEAQDERERDPGQAGDGRQHDRDEQRGRRAGPRRPQAPGRRRLRHGAQRADRRTRSPTKTAASQRSRARRAEGRSRRALSASTGWIRPARRAGSRAAASVTPTPTSERHDQRAWRDGRAVSSVTDADGRGPRRPSRSRAARRGATPISDPTTPSDEGLGEHERRHLAAGRAGGAQQADGSGPARRRSSTAC